MSSSAEVSQASYSIDSRTGLTANQERLDKGLPINTGRAFYIRCPAYESTRGRIVKKENLRKGSFYWSDGSIVLDERGSDGLRS